MSKSIELLLPMEEECDEATQGSRQRKGIKEKLKMLSKLVSKTGLFVFFILYTVAGAKVFQLLEQPSEMERQKQSSLLLVDARKTFLTTLLNMTSQDESLYLKKVSTNLKMYESVVEMAEKEGLSPLNPEMLHYQWNFIESIFFASTVITTIGYGNMAPVTINGRVFCILYGFVGIPVTLTVIAELGSVFANIVSSLYEKLTKKLIIFSKYRKSHDSIVSDTKKRALIAFGGILALLLYLSVGAGLFIGWEDWTFFEAFYFCFITMTTIGLGDVVPERTEFMLVCTLYILIGLALTSTIIELVRRQYAESWQQMMELSGRIGELSGPLADQLKKLGQHDMSVNPDFKELINAIQRHRLEALYKLEPKWKNESNFSEFLRSYLKGNVMGGSESEEFLKKKKVIQIVIYESSV